MCLDEVLKFKEKIIYLPACLLYSFNIFRIMGPLNENVIFLLVLMPLFFLFYFKLMNTNKWRYVFILTILSLASGPMGANLPVFLIPYLLMLLYFGYFMLTTKSGNWGQLIVKNFALLSLFLLCNLYWLIPLTKTLLAIYSSVIGPTLWNVSGSGTYYDHFRLIGLWGFRTGNYLLPYYPFYKSYDTGILLITTFLVSILSFAFLLFQKKDNLHAKTFFGILAIVSFFLLAGAKPPFGFIYNWIYQNVLIFKSVRDSFMKFVPLFIFAMSFCLALSINYILEKRSQLIRWMMILAISAIVLVNAYPIFTTEAMTIREWNGGQTGNVVKVPEYWGDAKVFLENQRIDSRIFVSPYNRYGSSSNWEFGMNLAGNVADSLVDKPILFGWEIENTSSDDMIKNAFANSPQAKFNMQRYLGFLNSNYVLQENEIEWRFEFLLPPPRKITSPSVSNGIILMHGFNEIAEFGNYTQERLSRILNEEPNKTIHDELYSELTNRPALVLYSLQYQYFVPHIYAPKKILLSNGSVDSIPGTISDYDGTSAPGIYLTGQNQNKTQIMAGEIHSELPVLEYKKISSTKYRLRIHSADPQNSQIPIVFSESFNDDWKAFVSRPPNYNPMGAGNLLQNYRVFEGNGEYQASSDEVEQYAASGWVTDLGDGKQKQRQLMTWASDRMVANRTETYSVDFISKNLKGTIQNDNLPDGDLFETLGAPSIDENNHLMANGYANSWVLNPAEICQEKGTDGKPAGKENGFCIKNPDGTYDFELVIEFSPQKNLVILQVLALVIFLGCVALLAMGYQKNK